MIYTIEKANLVSEQLRRFTTAYAHHVVGQFANIDFWLNEVQEALKVIDQYKNRFTNILDAQKEWIENHDTLIFEYCPHCGGKCELSNGNPSPPRRVSSSDLDEARRELINTTYYFLTRCYRMKLINDDELKQKCNLIGTSIDPNDLKI